MSEINKYFMRFQDRESAIRMKDTDLPFGKSPISESIEWLQSMTDKAMGHEVTIEINLQIKEV